MMKSFIHVAVNKIYTIIKSRLLMRMLVSYFIVILVSCVIYFSMYNYAFDSMRAYIMRSGRDAQSFSIKQIENCLDETRNMLIQMSNNHLLIRFALVSSPLQGSDYNSLYNMQQQVQHYKQTHSFIQNVIIYYKNANVICTNRTATTKVDTAYEAEFGYLEMNVSEWEKRVRNVIINEFWPIMTLKPHNTVNRVITYLQRFPSNNISHSAIAITQIDANYLLEALSLSALSQNSGSYLVEGNNVLFSCGTTPLIEETASLNSGYHEIRVNNSKYAVFSSSLKNYGLKLISVYDLDMLMADTTRHKSILIWTFLIVFIIELIYALTMTRRNYKPIKDILHILPTEIKDGKDELETIRLSISHLNSESEQIRQQLSKNQDVLQEMCISRLLGLEPGFEQFDFYQSGIPRNYQLHYVCILYCEANVQNAWELFTAQLNMLRTSDYITKFEYSSQYMALIISLQDAVDISQSLSAFTKAALECKSSIVIGTGLPANTFKEISRSFSEARIAVQQARINGERIVIYNDIKPQRETYDYPADLETALCESILEGNAEKATGIIDRIYGKIRDSSSSPYRLQVVLTEIYGTLLKLRSLSKIDAPDAERRFCFLLNEIEFSTNPYRRYCCILEAVRFYCEKVSGQITSDNEAFCRRIQDYVTEHFSDNMLCLNSIAAEFNISSKYLSKFFKRQTGCNLSTFIENIRMKQISILLKEGEHTIAQLADLCGYTNTNTFYKAFKRYWGMTPSSFKNRTNISIEGD